tara:strand:- start:429 stop:644 length:216 start_codon:yes stop_codon:yes gene_type:complete
MSYEVTIKADLDDNAFKSIKLEIEKMGRSTVTIKKKDLVEFNIKSDDSVSLRASLNAITKLFTAYEKIKGL